MKRKEITEVEREVEEDKVVSCEKGEITGKPASKLDEDTIDGGRGDQIEEVKTNKETGEVEMQLEHEEEIDKRKKQDTFIVGVGRGHGRGGGSHRLVGGYNRGNYR